MVLPLQTWDQARRQLFQGFRNRARDCQGRLLWACPSCPATRRDTAPSPGIFFFSSAHVNERRPIVPTRTGQGIVILRRQHRNLAMWSRPHLAHWRVDVPSWLRKAAGPHPCTRACRGGWPFRHSGYPSFLFPSVGQPPSSVDARRGGFTGPPLFFQLPARVLCGSGQQYPFRAPRRVQRIAFAIVSSGVSWGGGLLNQSWRTGK